MRTIQRSLDGQINKIQGLLDDRKLRGVYTLLNNLGRNQIHYLNSNNTQDYLNALSEISLQIVDVCDINKEDPKGFLGLLYKVQARASATPAVSQFHSRRGQFRINTKFDLTYSDEICSAIEYFNLSLENGTKEAHNFVAYYDQKDLLAKLIPKTKKEFNTSKEYFDNKDILIRVEQGLQANRRTMDSLLAVNNNPIETNLLKNLRPYLSSELATYNILKLSHQYFTTAFHLIDDNTTKSNFVDNELSLLSDARKIVPGIAVHDFKNLSNLNLSTIQIAKYCAVELKMLRQINLIQQNSIQKEVTVATNKFKYIYSVLSFDQKKESSLRSLFATTRERRPNDVHIKNRKTRTKMPRFRK